MSRLSKKQSIVYDYIARFITKHHYAPTVREICEGVGLESPSTVHEHLVQLKAKGLISYEPKTPRTIQILNLAEELEEYRKEYGKEPSIVELSIPLWLESYAYDKRWDLSMLLEEAILNRINVK